MPVRRALLTLSMSAAALAVSAASASATSCARPVGFPADRAAVVVSAVAQPGLAAPDGQLASPAAWGDPVYEKGAGPSAFLTETALLPQPGPVSLNVTPRASERWRLVGRFDGGVLLTTFCDGSRPDRGGSAPMIVTAGSAIPAVRSRFDGVPLTGAPPTVRVRPGGRVLVRLAEPGDLSARLVAPQRSTGLRRSRLGEARYRVQVGPPATGTRRIVVTTATGFFAFALQRTPGGR